MFYRHLVYGEKMRLTETLFLVRGLIQQLLSFDENLTRRHFNIDLWIAFTTKFPNMQLLF